MRAPRAISAGGAVAWLALAGAAAGGERPYPTSEEREPCAAYAPLRSPYFGDLHVHTTFSQDASTQGTRNRPRDAYRFARGERLGIQPYDGDTALRSLKLERPLDFAAVTDHAELMGETRICETPGLPGHDSLSCWIYRNYPRVSFFLMNANSSRPGATRHGFCGPDGVHCREAALLPWREIQAAAEGAYDRSSACRFTTFVAYEWTGGTLFSNLHRNVIFRNERVPELPTGTFEASHPEDLWRALRADCLEGGEGCDAIIIPHNSNLSAGLMFQTVDSDGNPLTVEQARVRAELERLVEVMQHKGDSECRLGAGTTDELCGFEKLSFENFSGKFVPFLAREPGAQNFVRWALTEGLVQRQALGANPFKFGLLASTDTHLGTPGAVREDRHPGHGGAGPSAAKELPKGLPDDLEFNPGGLAVLWAEENTRDALFEAMRRREVYGTSGPRISVRFFAGWSYPRRLCISPSFVETGYAQGVPMGGDLPPLPQAPGAAPPAPRLALWALRDPGTPDRPGTKLERLQIVKGWVEQGEHREAVYDVAAGPHGAGADSLCRVWVDPDFDSDAPAFYYARVLEIATPRWSALVCDARGVDCADPQSVPAELKPCCDPRHRRTIHERAWTSPIWYTPGTQSAQSAAP